MELLQSFFYNPDNVIGTIMLMSLLLGFNKKFIISEKEVFKNFNNILIIYFFGSVIYIAFVDNDFPLSRSAVFVAFVILYAKVYNLAINKIKKTFKKTKKRS